MTPPHGDAPTLYELLQEVKSQVDNILAVLQGRDGNNGLVSRTVRLEERMDVIADEVDGMEGKSAAGNKWRLDIVGLIIGTAMGTAFASLLIWLFHK